MKNPGIMIAAPASGSGKTTITCGIMAALQNRSLRVAACKCGPDYIDPMFHREVLGIPSENLDLFFCRPEMLKKLYLRHAGSADITVTEGVMGYYDGFSLESETASSYDVARTLDISVILVVPCRGMALSVVPAILGMLEFRKDSHIRGILLNRISGMLYPRMKQMIEEELGKRGYKVPVIGYVPEQELFHLESRHLGLVLPEEIDDLKAQLCKAGECLTETVDLDLLLKIAGSGQENLFCEKEAGLAGEHRFTRKDTVRIAVARDEAFCFYYQDNMELLRELGCELLPFSPLHDKSLPENIQGMLLGGGYPELYTKQLSENRIMCEAVKRGIQGGLPCIAECGGFLYLHSTLEGKDGIFYPMAGVIEGQAFRTDRLGRFGYILLQPQKEGMYLREGEELRGHEFHYWDSTANGQDCLAVKPGGTRSWKCIYMEGTLFAGFPHIHFYSNREFAERFVAVCRERKCHL